MTTPRNPAIPIWVVLHNAAMWTSGVLWARDQVTSAVAMGAFGLFGFVWIVGLIHAPVRGDA